MSDSDKKKSAENDEVESPADGPTPDWLKAATSTDSGSGLTDENTPSWLKEIKSGKTLAGQQSDADPADDNSGGMSDLERLLAEEGIDLGTVAEERPKGAEGMSARDWIISTSDDDLIRKRVGEDAMAEVLDETQGPFDSAAEAAPADDVDNEMSDLERLLAEEGIDLGAVAEERPEGAEGMSARDWIISTSDDDLIRKRVGSDTAADLLEEAATAVETSRFTETQDEDDKMVVTDDLPDWLKESREDFRETNDFADFDDSNIVADDELPDWLREAEQDTPVAVEVEASAETVAGDEGDLPDWLQDEPEERANLDEVPELGVVMASALADDEGDKMVVADDLPDWLRETHEDLSALPLEDSADEIVVEDELPNWLREAAEAEVVAESESVTEDEVLPDWLTGVEEDVSTDRLSTADVALDLGKVEAEVADDELPDWLKEAQEETEIGDVLAEAEAAAAGALEADEEDLPDWLRDSADEDGPEPILEMAPAVDNRDLDDDSDLPDWLKDIDETGEDLFVGMAAMAGDSADDLPDWLSDVSQEATSDNIFEASEPSPEEPTIEIVEEGLPDWLQAVDEQGFADLLEVNDLTAATVEPIAQGLEEEKALDWLRTAAEAETEAVTEVVPEPAVETPAPQPGKPGDIPDWLKKLRQGEPDTMVPQSAATPVPGPLPTPHYAAIQVAPVAQSARVVAPAVPGNLPSDAGARLEMARTARRNGNLEEALAIYNSLVQGGAELGAVINDIQDSIKTYPSSYLLFQVMGDAMMKDGRLQNALEAYRQALARLPG